MSVNEQQVGAVLLLKEVLFPQEIFEHVVSTFDPSLLKIAAGEIKIHINRQGENITVAGLCAHPLNKIGDILIWHTLTEDSRNLYVTYIVNADVAADHDPTLCRITKYSIAGCILLTYLMHGSVAGLRGATPLVPKFALDASGLKSTDLTMTNITNVANFHAVRFKMMAHQVTAFMKILPKTFQSRMALGYAGNRSFAIAKMILPLMERADKEFSSITSLYTREIIDRAPFATFHPDHPLNPMGSSAKYVLAVFGAIIKGAKKSVEDYQALNPQLFIKGIVDAMNTDLTVVTGKPPNPRKFRRATNPEFSMAEMISEDHEPEPAEGEGEEEEVRGEAPEETA